MALATVFDVSPATLLTPMGEGDVVVSPLPAALELQGRLSRLEAKVGLTSHR